MAGEEDEDDWGEIDFSSLRQSITKERHLPQTHARDTSTASSGRGFIALNELSMHSDKIHAASFDKDATVRSNSARHGPGSMGVQTLPKPPVNRTVPRPLPVSAGNDRVQGIAKTAISTRASLPTRVLSRYSETADDDIDFDCLDVVSTPKNERARRVQDRLRKGLQPRRHIPTPSDLGRISAWQADEQGVGKEESFDEDFELPEQLVLDKVQLITNKLQPRALETDEWDEPSHPQRHKTHLRSGHGRESTGSSSFSLSVTSTVDSEDVTDGLELPDVQIDLGKRFKDNNDRRAAGETLRGLSTAHSAHESMLQGLELDADMFVTAPGIKHANVRRGIASSPSEVRSTVRPTGTLKARLPIPAFGTDDSLRAESSMRQDSSIKTLRSTNQHSTEKQPRQGSGSFRSHSNSPQKENGSPVGTLRSQPNGSQRIRPAFLPGGASADRSYHVSAMSTRQQSDAGSTRVTPQSQQQQRQSPSPSKRRATASEALKSELSRRKPTLTHIRSKTYGEGHELDGIEDLPTGEERGTIRQREGSRRRPSGPSTQPPTTSTRAKAALLAEERLQQFREQRDRVSTGQTAGSRLRPGAVGTMPASVRPPPHPSRDTAFARRREQNRVEQQKPGSSSSAPATTRPPISGGNLFPQSTKAATMTGSRASSKKRKHGLPLLIANLNSVPQRQQCKNMRYNPTTFRWEGNEEELERFDSVSRTPPRIALISNRVHTASAAYPATAAATSNEIGKKLQVEKGMVFDPEQMCWLKVSMATAADGTTSSEEDPFEGIDDLVVDAAPVGHGTMTSKTGEGSHMHHGSMHATVSEQHFMVGEEFDVGPGFIKRQRAYEAIWQKTTAGWVLPGQAAKALEKDARRARLWELYHLVCD